MSNIIYGADVGTQLSKNVAGIAQQRANTRGTNKTTQGIGLDNQKKRMAIEEYILNTQRRAAERGLGTKTAESGMRRLPSEEQSAIATNDLTTADAQMDLTPEMRNVRKTGKLADGLANEALLENADAYKASITSGLYAKNSENWKKVGDDDRSVYINKFAATAKAFSTGNPNAKAMYEKEYKAFAKNRKNHTLLTSMPSPENITAGSFNDFYGSALNTEEMLQKKSIMQQAQKDALGQQGQAAFYENAQAFRDHKYKLEQMELMGLLDMKKASMTSGGNPDELNEKIALKVMGDIEVGTGQAKGLLADAVDQFNLLDEDGNSFTDEAMGKAATSLFNDASQHYLRLAELKRKDPVAYRDAYGDFAPSYPTSVKQMIHQKIQSGAFKAEIGYDMGSKDVMPGEGVMANKKAVDEELSNKIVDIETSGTEDMFEEITDSLVDQVNAGEDLADRVEYTNAAALGNSIEEIYQNVAPRSEKDRRGRTRKNMDPKQTYRQNMATAELRKVRNNPPKSDGKPRSHRESLKAASDHYMKEEKRLVKLHATMELLALSPKFQESPSFVTANSRGQYIQLKAAAEKLLPTLK